MTIAARFDSTSSSSLLGKMIAFHVVFQSFQKEIVSFGQLSTFLPGILVTLDKEIG